MAASPTDPTPQSSKAAASARPVLRLSDDKLPRGPWLYPRRVVVPDGEAAKLFNGALVEVQDESGRFFGHGFWNGASDVRVRMIQRGRRRDLDRPKQFILGQIKAADDLRRKTLRLPSVTNAYRVVHGEGDNLSGLVIDRLADTFVAEYHALGFFKLREDVEWAIKQLYPRASVVHRVPDSALRAEKFEDREVAGLERQPVEEVLIEEHGIQFPILPAGGHKTGFFCDQRDNRRRVGELSSGARVLDLCTNSGGFALNAARGGARSVTAVDLDERVLPRAERAAQLNSLDVQFTHADVFPYLRGVAERGERFDLIVCDPPKLAASRNKVDAALVKYTDMNALALAALKPRGLLSTYSCSGAIDLPTFLGALFSAARRVGRGIQLLETTGPGPDHPQRPEFPRSRYLKGALLSVD